MHTSCYILPLLNFWYFIKTIIILICVQYTSPNKMKSWSKLLTGVSTHNFLDCNKDVEKPRQRFAGIYHEICSNIFLKLDCQMLSDCSFSVSSVNLSSNATHADKKKKPAVVQQ